MAVDKEEKNGQLCMCSNTSEPHRDSVAAAGKQPGKEELNSPLPALAESNRNQRTRGQTRIEQVELGCLEQIKATGYTVSIVFTSLNSFSGILL